MSDSFVRNAPWQNTLNMTLKKQKNIALNRLDELKELLENLKNNINTEHENKLNFNIDVKYPLLAEYGDLLQLLNRYSRWYKKHFVTAW